MRFTGSQIKTTSTAFKARQNGCISKLAKTDINEKFAIFRLLGTRPSRASHLRPKFSCDVLLLTQITEKIFEGEPLQHINMLMNLVSHLKKFANLNLNYGHLDGSFLQIYIYSDASFPTKHGQTSQYVNISFFAHINTF